MSSLSPSSTDSSSSGPTADAHMRFCRHSLLCAMSIWYNDSAEILADADDDDGEPSEAEQEQRMARVLKTLGIANGAPAAAALAAREPARPVEPPVEARLEHELVLSSLRGL